MRRYNIFKGLLLLAVLSISLSACQEDISKVDELLADSNSAKLSTAAPTIIGVYDNAEYMSSDTPSPCIEAQMGQDLIISGENLEGVTSLTFHGIEIETADFYSQWNLVSLRVPRKLPKDGAAAEVVCTTDLGTAKYVVDLAIPTVEVNSVSNEFALPGGKTDINGSYLTLCEFGDGTSKIYLENEAKGYKRELVVDQLTDQVATVVIPDDAPDNSLFTFEISGVAQSRKFHYRATDMFLTPDAGTEVVKASGTAYTTIVAGAVEDDIENIFGDEVKYYRVKGNVPGGKELIEFYVTSDFEIPEGKTAADYNVVYELNTMVGCAIPKGTTYKFVVNNKGVNMWENYSKSEVGTDGKWVTQRVDFTQVKSYLTAANGKQKFVIKAVGAMPKADHAFANFRIEPIIK